MISIITPFYNTDKYLEQCLASIKGQTFSDFECLMIDDGSYDTSRIIAQKYANEDKRFILVNEPNHHIGFPAAKNLGLDMAAGEYICFIDSDDYIEPRYLELLYKGLIETKADMCCCRYCAFKNGTTPEEHEFSFSIKIYNENKIEIMFEDFGTSFMWNKIYKRELFNKLRFDDVMALSDTLLCYKLYERANYVATISTYLINYRRHTESMSFRMHNYEPTYWEHRLKVYLTMCSYLFNHFPQSRLTIAKKFRSEITYRIKPYIQRDIYLLYYNKPEFKQLIKYTGEPKNEK